jgi:indoleamine 2,3-dioxygenase
MQQLIALFLTPVIVPFPVVMAIGVIILTLLFNNKKTSDVKTPNPDHQPSTKTINTTSPLPASPLPKSNPARPSSPAKPNISIRPSYRIEEENKKRLSSEYTRRGQLWSRHASWHLPNAPQQATRANSIYANAPGLEHVKSILRKFDVDPFTGFMPSEDPLQRLPYARYHLWEDLGDDLPKLLGARLGQAREPLRQLPVLSTDKLVTDAELRRAHLLLCLFAHAYVWGGESPLDVIPEGIAVPLWEVSEKLGVPPVLGHPNIVLYNWRRLDVNADLCMENFATLNNFFDGRDESWFYLITADVEAKGAPGIVPMMLAVDAIQRFNEEIQVSKSTITDSNNQKEPERYILANRGYEMYDVDQSDDEENIIYTNEALTGELSVLRVSIFVTEQLKHVAKAILGMCESIAAMREGCHPFIFFHRVRPFLSGWKHNPTLPNGVIYQGVSTERFQFYGGSAAQSALIPFYDITLGIDHDSTKSKDFLLAMRDYMIKPHREFLKYLESIACVRPFVLERLNELAKLEKAESALNGSQQELLRILRSLRDSYDLAVAYMQRFRGGHIALVAEYIMAQQKQAIPKGGLESTAGGKGTGGTDLMNFLKPLREDCTNT